MIGASTSPRLPELSISSATAQGIALPANPDGSQAPGTPCNKIPASLINPIGQAMINLYPAPNANNASAGTTTSVSPCASWTTPGSISGWTTRSPTRITPLAVSATTRHSPLCPAAHQDLPKRTPSAATSASETTRATSPWARPMCSPPTWSTRPAFGYNRIFDYITSQGTGTCISATIVPGGIPNANLGCAPAALPVPTPTAADWFRPIVPGRLLGPRRSRLLSVPGWNQHLLFPRLARLHPQ